MGPDVGGAIGAVTDGAFGRDDDGAKDEDEDEAGWAAFASGAAAAPDEGATERTGAGVLETKMKRTTRSIKAATAIAAAPPRTRRCWWLRCRSRAVRWAALGLATAKAPGAVEVIGAPVAAGLTGGVTTAMEGAAPTTVRAVG